MSSRVSLAKCQKRLDGPLSHVRVCDSFCAAVYFSLDPPQSRTAYWHFWRFRSRMIGEVEADLFMSFWLAESQIITRSQYCLDEIWLSEQW